MGKVRVYELAKDLGLESKDIISKAADMGINIKNHMSTLENDEIGKLKSVMGGKSQAAPVNASLRPEGARAEGSPAGACRGCRVRTRRRRPLPDNGAAHPGRRRGGGRIPALR